MSSVAPVLLLLTLCTLGLPSLATGAPAATQTLADPLDLSIANRKIGQLLDRESIADGNTRWTATPNLSFASSTNPTGRLAVNDSRGYVAKLALPPNPQRIKITAALFPSSSSKENNWTAIGLGNPDHTGITWDGGIFLLIHADGRFTFSAYTTVDSVTPASTRVRIHGEMSPHYRKGKPVQASFQYDTAKGTVSVWINSFEVVDNLDLRSKGCTPDLTYAGFSGYQQKAEVSPVSNFSIEIIP